MNEILRVLPSTLWICLQWDVPEGLHLDLRVDGWLNAVRISSLSEWDVLLFLYRHGTSLANAENIARLAGHSKSVVGKALDTLGVLGLVERSRPSQGVRFYRFALPLEPIRRESLEELLKLSQDRSGRLIVSARIKLRAQSIQSPGRSGLNLA